MLVATKKPPIVIALAVLMVIAGAWALLRLVPGSPLATMSGSSFVLEKGMRDSFVDTGSAADIGQVRDAVQAALTSEDAASAVDANHQPVLTHAQRVALLAQNESTAHAAKLASAVEFAMGDTPFVQSGGFVVEHWQGVLVSGQSAKAYVTGHDVDRQVDGTEWRDASYQARILLTRSSTAQHGWLVTKMISSPIEG